MQSHRLRARPERIGGPAGRFAGARRGKARGAIHQVMVDESQRHVATHPEPEGQAPDREPQVRRVPATARAAIRLLPYQREDIESPARFNWCCWSRQIGKSFTKSLRRILRGLKRRRNQVFLSAGERQSRELMLKAQQHCQALAMAAACRCDSSFEGMEVRHLQLTLPNGVRIIGLPANPHTVRGFTGDVFLDEFAMHREDREIWAAVFPTVLRGDGELDVASTPKGPANLFAELRDNPSFRHSTVTLHDAIAQGLRLDAEEIRRSIHDDALFRQEFLCEFLEEVGAFLTVEQIAACEDGTLTLPARLTPESTQNAERIGESLRAIAASEACFVGVDIGRRRDLTVLWALGFRGPGAGSRAEDRAVIPRGSTPDARNPSPDPVGRGVLVSVGVIEMREAPFREQYEVLRRLMGIRSVRRCCIDASGVGMAMAEAAEEEFGTGRVEGLTFTPVMKDRLATGLKRRIEDRTVRLPADDAVRADLHSVRWDVTVGGAGRFLVSREGDSHADRFWALALAVRAAESAGPPARVEFQTAGGLRFARAGIW
ncbi:MAG: terminase large subunit domain-containing protein [Phycisphaerae bacterium]